jgi:competence protein ComEA
MEQIAAHREMIQQNDKWEETEICIKQRFFITGEVQQPGLYEFQKEICLMDAIQMAGGLTDKADLQSVNPARIVRNGEKIQIPLYVKLNQDTARENTVSQTQASQTSSKININTATLNDLMQLPNIGASRAQDILDYRQTVGPFVSIEEIMQVSGIGPKTFASFQDLICIDGSG